MGALWDVEKPTKLATSPSAKFNSTTGKVELVFGTNLVWGTGNPAAAAGSILAYGDNF